MEDKQLKPYSCSRANLESKAIQLLLDDGKEIRFDVAVNLTFTQRRAIESGDLSILRKEEVELLEVRPRS